MSLQATVVAQRLIAARIILSQKPNQHVHHCQCRRWAASAHELTKGVNVSAAECTVQLCHIKGVKEPEHVKQCLPVKDTRHTRQLGHTPSYNWWQRHPQLPVMLSVMFICLQQMHNNRRTKLTYNQHCYYISHEAEPRQTLYGSRPSVSVCPLLHFHTTARTQMLSWGNGRRCP